MAGVKRGTNLNSLLRRFPTDDAILDAVFRRQAPDFRLICPNCGEEERFYRVADRKSYACGRCRHQVYPLARTIMASSPLPLSKWLTAAYYLSRSKNGLSAIELQGHIEVTYKVAWRMLHLLRDLMKEPTPQAVVTPTPGQEAEPGDDRLSGTVEADETLVGGRKRLKQPGTGMENKTCVFGLRERDGRVRTFAVKNRDKKTLFPLIKQNVKPGTKVFTDEHPIYTCLPKAGYPHESVNHGQWQWKKYTPGMGVVSTNGIEGHWSQLKRSFRGTYGSVSRKHLQRYLDEFSFRYNRRRNDSLIQEDLLDRLLSPVPGKGLIKPPTRRSNRSAASSSG